MNKSYSKIRHIQETNQRLEKRLLSEQDVPVSGQTPEQKGVETNRHVINLLNDGYKEVPKADLPDGQYSKKGAGYIINIFNQDGKTDTGYRFVMTFGIRGLYNGELNYGWDIDHIIPTHIAKTEEELIGLNHYTNLQPLCSHINRNIKKGNY